MAQERFKLDNVAVIQPDDVSWNFETTSTSDSTRAMSGTVYNTPLFTVESLNVTWGQMTRTQLSQILQAIVQRPSKPYVTVHYYSPFYNAWRNAQFYVAQGSLKIKTLAQNRERIESVTCNLIGREKIA